MAALLFRHLRDAARGGLLVATLLLVLSFVATAVPIGLGVLGDATVRDRLQRATTLEADVQSINSGIPMHEAPTPGAVPTADEVWGPFTAAVDRIRSGAAEPLSAVLGTARTVARSGTAPVLEAPITQRLTMLFDPAYADEIRLVEGRLPEAGPAAPLDPATAAPTRVEGIISRPTADELGWAIGQTRAIESPFETVEIELVGLFDPVDADSGYWQHITAVLEPSIAFDGNTARRVTGAVFAHPAALPVAASFRDGQQTRVWFSPDLGAIDASSAEAVATGLRGLMAVGHRVGAGPDGDPGAGTGGPGIRSLRFTAEIPDAIDAALEQHAATTAVLAMVVAGPAGVTAAVLALGCRLILERRRAALRLLSARGASGTQLRGLLGIEGLTIGLLPAALGAGIAAGVGTVLLDALPQPDWFVTAALLGVAPTLLLAAMAAGSAQRRARADLGLAHPRWRVLAETTIAALAVTATLLLLVRGPQSAGVDPLIAAAPLLLSLVACLLALRLYPVPLRAIVARARRARGAGAFLGAARALREPAIGAVPVLALLVGVAVAVSSAVLLSTLEGGLAGSARAQVGADLRVDGATPTAEQLAAVRELDGVVAAAGLSAPEPAMLEIAGVRRGTAVVVVDAAQLRAAQGDGPGLLPAGAAIAPEGARMPVVVGAQTAALIGTADDVRVGSVAARVDAVATGPSPIGARRSWVAIDASFADAALGSTPEVRSVLVRVEEGSLPAVEVGLRAILGADIRTLTPEAVLAELRTAPAVQGVRAALLAATVLSALLGALALVITLALAAPARARVLALLRTLGAPPRAGAALALWELGPPAIAAVVAGGAFGALVPVVVLAAVDLRPFTGSSVQPAYRVDAATLLAALGGWAAVALLAAGIAMLVARRMREAAALRAAEGG